METENNKLKADQKELADKRDEIAKMCIDSQANSEEIDRLNKENDTKADKMEKLSLEVTVVVTEKLALKKELTRIDDLYRNIKKDHKE